jgi:hypothetical protein
VATQPIAEQAMASGSDGRKVGDLIAQARVAAIKASGLVNG